MKMHQCSLILVLGLSALSAGAQTKDPTKVQRMEGIEIKNVDPGSVYEAMKVETGDVLMEVDHRRIQRIQEIEEIFRDIEPGRKVKIKVKHGGKVEEREMEVKSSKANSPSTTPHKK